MKVYFGLVDYETEGEVFEFDHMEYDFVLENTGDGIVIRDAMDRYVPIGYAAALDLIKALKMMKPMINAAVTLENISTDCETCI